MSEHETRIVSLLEELVALQKAAAARQEQMLQQNDQQNAAARERGERAIGLQQTAVARQRWFVRVWLGTLVFVIAAIVGVLFALSRYLH